jgi:uncharacterized protein
MSLSLYQATVPSYVQILEATLPLIDKAEAFCLEKGLEPTDIIQARLAENMLPFTFQITSIAHHSMGAIEGVKSGQFSPNRDLSEDFPGIRDRLGKALAYVKGLTEDEVNNLQGREVRFVFGDINIPFIGEEFLLSFSQPNFYFHVTTAYDILRWKGVKIGKMDYLGAFRTATTT